MSIKDDPLVHWRPNFHWYQPILSAVVVQASKVVMRWFNRIEMHGKEQWERAFSESARGVLSFSNHVSLFDDPLLTSNFGRTRHSEVRWIPADHLNFFGTSWKGALFSAGKCVPVVRGGGLEQPGLQFLVDRLKEGAWVHIFPEGGRSREVDARLRTPFKTGIGRLILQAQPRLLPFYHLGMQRILPIGSRWPASGQTVEVFVDSHQDVDDAFLSEIAPEEHGSQDERGRWGMATRWCEARLVALEERALRGQSDASGED